MAIKALQDPLACSVDYHRFPKAQVGPPQHECPNFEPKAKPRTSEELEDERDLISKVRARHDTRRRRRAAQHG